MKKAASKSRPLIAFAILSIAAGIVISRPAPTQRSVPLSGAEVSAELARVMGFGMV
ncbi:hypothetical protein PSP6_210181 [Paraburkholderia tropica]|uniref:hypothetical protein n=1 Tax=Paraburkholderia tropica TaxID=92647 RepID=UPI001CAD64D5|nr:hypothetical protein [Paraburkholderia tropica]CAG9202344.1 hypothetical protein PSP6_210181 [Paraburkholderia tropica]